jgi:TonB family protein
MQRMSQLGQHNAPFSSRIIMPLGIRLLVALFFVMRLDAQDWKPVHIVAMSYVAEAGDARISGVVRLRCVLNSDGSVARIDVLLGHKVFLKAVLENARQWRFATGDKVNGPTHAALLIYEFRLTDPTCGSHYREQFVFDQPDRVLVTSEYACPRPDFATERGTNPNPISK